MMSFDDMNAAWVCCCCENQGIVPRRAV
jgi:hypothetical protein